MIAEGASRWKSVFLKAFGFGVGFAFVLIAAATVWLWHASRPKLPSPWNKRAITATFDYVTTQGEANHIVFIYTLQNETNQDYRLQSNVGVEMAARLSREKSISAIRGEDHTIEFPVFVPSGQRSRFSMEISYPYNEKSAAGEDEFKHRDDVKAFVKSSYANLDGFVLYDDNNRYEIDFPKGW